MEVESLLIGVESLFTKCSNIIINSDYYIDLHDENILNLLSNILGFPDINTVEFYTNLKRIPALRAIKLLDHKTIIKIATDHTHYEILVHFLRKCPEELKFVINNICISKFVNFITHIHKDLGILVSISCIKCSHIMFLGEDDIDSLIKCIDFSIDFSKVARLILYMDKRLYKPNMKKILAKLLDTNKGLTEYLDKKLSYKLFQLKNKYLSYDTLDVLRELQLKTLPPKDIVNISDTILNEYITLYDYKMIHVLINDYGVVPTNNNINKAFRSGNFYLVKEWVNRFLQEGRSIKSIASIFIEERNITGLKWLIEQNIVERNRYSFLYYKNRHQDVLHMLCELKVEITENIIVRVFRLDIEYIMSVENIHPLAIIIYNNVTMSLNVIERILIYNLGENILMEEKWKIIRKHVEMYGIMKRAINSM